MILYEKQLKKIIKAIEKYAHVKKIEVENSEIYTNIPGMNKGDSTVTSFPNIKRANNYAIHIVLGDKKGE